MFLPESLTSGESVSSVASVDIADCPSLLVGGSYPTGNGTEQTSGWKPAADAHVWGNISLPLWALIYNISEVGDGCGPFPYFAPNISFYTILVRMGVCFLGQKAANAAAFGARFVTLYDSGVTSADIRRRGCMAELQTEQSPFARVGRKNRGLRNGYRSAKRRVD